jgi:transcriptional regulator with XRE-family HTH domain
VEFGAVPTRIIKFAETLANIVNQRSGGHVRKKLCDAVGISESLLSQYATGKAKPGFERLCKLASYLGVSLDYLVYGDGETRPTHSAGIEDDPLYDFIDTRLETIGARAEERNWALFKVAEIIVQKMDKISDRVARSGELSHTMHPGRISDQQSLYLERHANFVQIFATDFSYDIIERDDGTYIPGKFFPIVKRNILNGTQYQFILPKGGNWSAKIEAFQRFLRKDAGDIAVNRCQFRVARRTFISGIGILRINIDSLRGEHPILYHALSDYYLNDCLAYIIPPSTRLHGDLLVSRDKLELTMELFKESWSEADEPAQVETPKRRRAAGS